MHLLLFLVFGLVVGAIARLVVPGREPAGWMASLVIGVVGSFLGGFLGGVLGIYGDSRPAGFLVSVLGAVLLLVVYYAMERRRVSS